MYKEERMRKTGYPNPKGDYFCYVLDEEVTFGFGADAVTKIRAHAQTMHIVDENVKYKPFYVSGRNVKNAL